MSNRIDISLESILLRPTVRDDTFDQRSRLRGQLIDEFRFLAPAWVIRRGLHEDRTGDVRAPRQLHIIRVPESLTGERGNVVRPRVRPALRIDQMLVRIEHRDWVIHRPNSCAMRALSSPRS